MNDIQKGLKNCGIFLVAFLIIIFVGSKAPLLLFLVCPSVCAGAGVLITRNKKAVLRWAILGLIAGAGFYFAI